MSHTETMIPTLPDSVTIKEKLEFYENLLSNLEDQSTIHVNWHTHKQNPAVCWICDIPILARVIYKCAEAFITKSPLDIETELSSGKESEPEIEDDSKDGWDTDINEPEYDIDEDTDEDGYCERTDPE